MKWVCSSLLLIAYANWQDLRNRHVCNYMGRFMLVLWIAERNVYGGKGNHLDNFTKLSVSYDRLTHNELSVNDLINVYYVYECNKIN